MPSTLKTLTGMQRQILTTLLDTGVTSGRVATALSIPRRSASRLLEHMIRDKQVKRKRAKPTRCGQPCWIYHTQEK